MTPSVRTLQGSKIKSFKGSSSLCPRGSNSRGFSSVRLVNQVEAFHFKEFGNSLRDFAFVVIDGVESGARRQDGGYHLQNY